jgi:hypothetical protein
MLIKASQLICHKEHKIHYTIVKVHKNWKYNYDNVNLIFYDCGQTECLGTTVSNGTVVTNPDYRSIWSTGGMMIVTEILYLITYLMIRITLTWGSMLILNVKI